MFHDPKSAQSDRVRPPLGLILLFVFAQLFTVTTASLSLLLIVYVMNPGVNPAWIIFLISSFPRLVEPSLLR